MLKYTTKMTTKNETKDKILPTETNIVTLLCKYVREEVREVHSKSGTGHKQYVVYACPKKGNCINSNGEIAFQKGKGFTNPCNHLKSCLAHGSLEELHKTYSINVEREQSEISNFFNPIVNLTIKEKEMIQWVQLIVDESLPPGVVKREVTGHLRPLISTFHKND